MPVFDTAGRASASNAYTSGSMPSRPGPLGAALPACAPLPALVIGIVAMRQLGVGTQAWAINLAATILGLLIWTAGRHLPPLTRRGTLAILTAVSLAAILLPFASDGVLGVYRWVSVAGLRLHASAIVTPLLILCVAVAATRTFSSALTISVTGAIILALQPDAAQAISFAAACAVVLIGAGPKTPRRIALSVILLGAASFVSFVRPDPLAPVAYVEEIVGIVASKGPGWAVMATVTLLLLPAPFLAAWYRHRRPVTLALGVYVVMTVLAPLWGTFPVPVMGYGASPILGYFLALTADRLTES